MTYEDGLSLKSSLEDVILKLSGRASLAKDFLKDSFSDSSDQRDFVINFLKEHKTNVLSREEILTALKELDEKLGQTKPVDLALAVDPSEGLKKEISAWISKNIKGAVLPRYTINPAVVGGAKITYNGNFLDLSLRNKIDGLPLFKRKI